MKLPLLSIQQRFDIFMPKYLGRLVKSRKYRSISNAIEFSSCLPNMVSSLGVVIDNTDAYDDGMSYEIWRLTPDGGTKYAHDDLCSLTNETEDCINFIDMLRRRFFDIGGYLVGVGQQLSHTKLPCRPRPRWPWLRLNRRCR